MAYYVKIPRINGAVDYFKLASWLNSSGLGTVDYDNGGWQDNSMNNAAPHLKFEFEDDALAYVLTNGGSYSISIPEVAASKEQTWLGD